jgi:D-alanyl-D-alanine dipeptidase
VLFACLANCLATPAVGVEAPGPPADFVRLRDVDATIVQDIRYATPANFTQARVPGYQAGECFLLREAAEALKLVQDDLRPRGFSLKVYDCYRPIRAVKTFLHWVRKKPAVPGESRYWPRVPRGDLLRLGYISAKSIHSTGVAIDLTLVALPPAQVAPYDAKAAYAACNAAAEAREPDNSLDMGTGFDCFDLMSHTASSEINAAQQENRRVLVNVMSAQNFKNYEREWWHFTYVRLPKLPKAQDFVITREQGVASVPSMPSSGPPLPLPRPPTALPRLPIPASDAPISASSPPPPVSGPPVASSDPPTPVPASSTPAFGQPMDLLSPPTPSSNPPAPSFSPSATFCEPGSFWSRGCLDPTRQ